MEVKLEEEIEEAKKQMASLQSQLTQIEQIKGNLVMQLMKAQGVLDFLAQLKPPTGD